MIALYHQTKTPINFWYRREIERPGFLFEDNGLY